MAAVLLLIMADGAHHFIDIDRPLESLPYQILRYDLLRGVQFVHISHREDRDITLRRLILNKIERLQFLQQILIYKKNHGGRRLLYLIDGIDIGLHHRHIILRLFKPAL